MRKQYTELMTEIREIEARQRELVQLDSPTQDEQDELMVLEGRVMEKRALANEIHEAEVEEARSSKPVEIASTTSTDGGFIRSMLASGEKEIDLKYSELRNLTAGSGSGSYLVPQEWHNKVEEYRFERDFMRSLATVIKTDSTHNIPVLTTLASVAITGENTAYTSADPTVAQVILYAYKITGKTIVSEELMADAAYDVDGFLARAYGLSIGAVEQNYFMTGTGSSQPTGIFNKSADKTFASASAITKDELIDTAYGLAREYRDGACWFMDDTTVAYIAKLKLDVTTSGTTPYFWTDAVGGEPPRLLGYPVYTDSSIADIGTGNKTVCFGNPSYYLIGDRGGINLKRLELNEYGTTYAVNVRVDGVPLNASAFYVAKQG